MSTLIETSGSFRAVTIIGKNAVYYSVERRIGNEYVAEWEHTEHFARDRAHRPGGVAFVLAAREQDRRMTIAQRQAIEQADYATTAEGIEG